MDSWKSAGIRQEGMMETLENWRTLALPQFIQTAFKILANSTNLQW